MSYILNRDYVAYVTTSNLGAGATYSSGILELLPTYTHVQTNITADQDGTINIYWYSDAAGTDTVRTLSIPFVAADGYKVYSAPAGFGSYVEYTFVNGSTPQGDFYYSTTFLTHALSPQLLNIESPVSSKMVAQMNRSVIMGQTDGGQYKNVPVDEKGHLEVALHHPRLPFGSIHTERLTPIFQTDAVYGLNDGQVNYSSTLSGSVGATDSNFELSTGTTIYSQATLQSRKRLRYRPGQGVVGRFTSLYTTGVADSYQISGFGHAEDGVYFGYKGATFGILYTNRGVRECRTLTITTGSSTAENVTVTLNGTGYSVAVTNSGNIQRTVWEISQGTYAGWTAFPKDDTIVFVADSAGSKSGAYSLSATTAVGTFASTKVGVAATEQFIQQSDWNGDVCDGTGPSGFNLDPTKGNVYQVGIQYLGYGAITFDIETQTTGNNANFVTVHTLELPNALSTTSFRNPSFPFTMAVYSAGSTTDLTLKAASFAGFIEGDIYLSGNRFSYFNSLQSTVDAGSYHCLFTVLNSRYHNGLSSQIVINLLDITASVKHTQPVRFYVIKNGTLVGNPDFSSYSTESNTLVDTAATTVTWSNNSQLVWSGGVGETGDLDHLFGDSTKITLQPGEWVTVAARALQNTAAWVSAGLNTREDQ